MEYWIDHKAARLYRLVTEVAFWCGPFSGRCYRTRNEWGVEWRLLLMQGGDKVDDILIYIQGNSVLAMIEAAGWPIWPLIIASVISLGIIFDRAWSLRDERVLPADLLPRTMAALKAGMPVPEDASPLGRILAAGIGSLNMSREVMKESLEETGRAVAHDLSRYLTTLGTIASVSPLLGLLGTVIGMVEIFGSQTPTGGNPAVLAHGISVALYNTAFGLIVAIPSMIAYRHFRGKVEGLLIEMEQQAVKLVEIAHGDRP